MLNRCSQILCYQRGFLLSFTNYIKTMSSGNIRERPELDVADGVKEIKIPVPWGHIAGKFWGPETVQPILAIHGWQDNAGSYDTLIPLLPPEVSILAIDLPGHGLSSYTPTGAYYHFMDGVISVRRIVRYFDWKKVSLMGHSLGSAISFLYASSFPSEVEKLIGLDAIRPVTVPNKDQVNKTGRSLDLMLHYEKQLGQEAPSYTYNEVVDILLEGTNRSLTRKSAEIMLKRGAEKFALSNGTMKYKYRRDPRLKVLGMPRVSHELLLEYAKNITCEVLQIKGNPGLDVEPIEYYYDTLEAIKKSAKRVEFHEVEGTHHLHLNNPERIAPIISKFLTS